MISYRYDHRHMHPSVLHEAGIRSTKEIEEVIEGISIGDSAFLKEINAEAYFFIGFTKNSKPLEIVVQTNEEVDIITLDVRRPIVHDIINKFCRYCYSTKYPNT